LYANDLLPTVVVVARRFGIAQKSTKRRIGRHISGFVNEVVINRNIDIRTINNVLAEKAVGYTYADFPRSLGSKEKN